MKVSRVEDLGEEHHVFDISVEKNHNFFIKPIGSTSPVLVSNCHMYTAQAQACMLKELEMPSPNTIWLLASMNPEKLPAATLRRCHKITLQPVKREAMVERIGKIARREKLDLKKIDGGEKVLSAIADVSCGSMSTAISALESVVYLQGSEFDYRKAISTVFSGAEADQDEAAARVLYASLTRNDDLFMQTVIPIPSGHRSLLLKVRWLIDHLMLSAVGAAKFTPPSARKFAELRKKMKGELSSGELFRVLGVLNDAEQRMNLNLDERATFVSMLGRYIVENK